MPRRQNRGLQREEKKRRELVKAATIVLPVIGLVAAAGVAIAIVKPPPIDETTGCPLGSRAPEAHTIVLLDETDRLSAGELAYAQSLIWTEYSWLPIGGRLTIRNIVADPGVGEEVSICRMRDSSNALGIAVHPEELQAQFESLAGAELNALMTGLARAEPQDASPILEYVEDAASRVDFGRDVAARRLVIHSDLAQHSDLATHYRGGDLDLSEEALDAIWEDMSGVQVRLHYIERRSLSDLQGRRHQAFWTGLFEDMNAEVHIGHELILGEEPDRPTVIYRPSASAEVEVTP